MAEVQVPGLGGVKKEYLYGGLALTAGIVGYAYWNRQRSAASVTPTDTAQPSDGSVTDSPAGSQQVTGNAQYAGSTTDGTGGGITTNDAWANHAVEVLAAEGGWDAATVRSALGKYLQHMPLSDSEQNAVRAAITAAGYPPVGSFSIVPSLPTPAPSVPSAPRGFHVVDTTATGFTLGWYADTSVATYHLYEGSKLVGTDHGTYHPFTGLQAGHRYGPYYLAAVSSAGKESTKAGPLYVTTKAGVSAKVGNLRVTELGRTSATLLWTAAPGATAYHVSQDGRSLGTYHSTQAAIRNLKPNTRHTLTVAAVGADGKAGPSASVSFTTKK